MHRFIASGVAVAALIATVIVAAQQRSAAPLVEVFKTPTCGCCSQWVDHLRKNGFTVRTTDLNDLTEIKKSRGVPDQVQSCHTAVVDG
jgi:hypothetical protein